MLRRHQRGACVICGKEFEGTIRRIYCSNTCAARAYRQRKKAQHQEGEA
jgi:predicted nucleic acid-binding Zn ribbon protein